jgi:Flp pilus assembly protein TadD
MVTNSQDLNVVLERVRALLNEGKTDEAVEALRRVNAKPPMLENARGVCLLRLGKVPEALRIFRGLMYPQGNVAYAPDAPPSLKVNFATALLLTGDVIDGLAVLKEVNAAHPAAGRVWNAYRRWRKTLNPINRLLALVGLPPARPVAMDFPVGEL